MSCKITKERAEQLVSAILSEDVLTVPQACKAIKEATGRPIGRATLHRWILRGTNGVKLESIKLSSRIILTSSQAISRFLVALNAR